MSRSAQIATAQSDTVIELSAVSKIYSQRQKVNGNVWKQLTHPQYKQIHALDDVSFTIPRGQFVAYAGPNGAGKSTTFKLLCGMLSPDNGQVRALNMEPIKNRIALMKRTGVLFGGRRELWWDHPVISSFEWKKTVWDIDDATYNDMLRFAIDELEIEPILHTFARELSLGQRMRAELALMLLHNPELILLDEPTLGLDVLSKQRMIDMLKRLNQSRGATILVTSHDMDDLQHMAQRIIMINSGKMAFDGSFDKLLEESGALRRITLTASKTPELRNSKLVEHNGNRYTFEIDISDTSMKEVMYEIAGMDGVDDLESSRAPIEEVIARLYSRWNSAADKKL